MAKTLILGPVLYPQNHFREFYLYLLDIVLSYHLIQLERKLTFLKPNFGSNFDPISPNLGPSICFSWVLHLIVVWHCFKLSSYAISKKLTSENGEKPNFGPHFDQFGPNLGPPIFFGEFYLC